MMDDQSVILFDGICNLCNGFVQFVIKRDKRGKFVFASLQSDEAKTVLKETPTDGDIKTIVLIEKNKIYTRSTAALRILRGLSGAWPLFYGFIIIPPFIRDSIYNLVARNRYKWFGRRDRCMIPTPDLKKKFLSDEDK